MKLMLMLRIMLIYHYLWSHLDRLSFAHARFKYILLVISSTVDVASPEPNAGLPDGVRVN